MAKHRGRLSPDEVKQQLAAGRPPAPPPAFNSPFAAARGELEKLVPVRAKGAPRVRPGAGASAAKPEPLSPLAETRRKNLADREALAESVKPLRRPGPRNPGG